MRFARPPFPIQIVTPRFTRPKGEPGPASPPSTREDFEGLSELPDDALYEIGLRRWGTKIDADEPGPGPPVSKTNPMLWLFPGEWYTSIPEGLPIVSITFQRESFKLGHTDNDIRFGCLSYGILKTTVD